LEGPHDAEAIEWSALKAGKNFVRREWTCEPKESGWSKTTPRNLGAELNVRGRGTCQSELGLLRSLMEVCTEEATFTFSGVDC